MDLGLGARLGPSHRIIGGHGAGTRGSQAGQVAARPLPKAKSRLISSRLVFYQEPTRYATGRAGTLVVLPRVSRGWVLDAAAGGRGRRDTSLRFVWPGAPRLVGRTRPPACRARVALRVQVGITSASTSYACMRSFIHLFIHSATTLWFRGSIQTRPSVRRRSRSSLYSCAPTTQVTVLAHLDGDIFLSQKK